MSWDDIPFWTGIEAGSQSGLFSPPVNCVYRRIYLEFLDISVEFEYPFESAYVRAENHSFPPPPLECWVQMKLCWNKLLWWKAQCTFLYVFPGWRKGKYWIKTSYPLPWASQSLPDSVCRGFIRISRFDHLFAAKTFQSDPIQDPVWIIDNSIEESEIGRDEAARRGWKEVVKSIQNPWR